VTARRVGARQAPVRAMGFFCAAYSSCRLPGPLDEAEDICDELRSCAVGRVQRITSAAL